MISLVHPCRTMPTQTSPPCPVPIAVALPAKQEMVRLALSTMSILSKNFCNNSTTLDSRNNTRCPCTVVEPKLINMLSKVFGLIGLQVAMCFNHKKAAGTTNADKYQYTWQRGATLVRESLAEENSVDAYFKKLVRESSLQETMTDPMISKEFQDLVGHCSGRLRDEIVLSLRFGNIPLLQVCRNPNGMRSMLKLFEHLSEFDQRQSVATALSRFIVSLFKDYHRQKVIEFCLSNFSDMENVQIFLDAEKHLMEIATDLRGCCMLMKSVEISKGLCRNLLFPKMTEICNELAVHPAGNYLVQKLFDFDIPQLTEDVLRSLQGSYHSLSVDKYGSHVMEKCLLRSNMIWFEEIAWELMTGRDFTELFTDPYGNYVVQAMLSRAKDRGLVIYDILRSMIDSEGEALQSSPYGGNLQKLIRRPNNRSGYFRCGL
ncbi:hypothetical protein MLD38_029649 [Melastoma candidum]|uniref:Uncharacterized protein n=1 Tax=Melastoma candidum TaxID=119954 RepID=A0ACB9N582_9MYRT|nr:hypothetical protein MLD38_029649 [Melastoma candidum]